MTAPDGSLSLFTVYRQPRDYPNSFVVRQAVILPGGRHLMVDPPAAVALSLEEARARGVPPGLCRLERSQGDDPAIVEVWI